AITDREAVFWECPVLFNFANAIENPIDAFVWTQEYGARIGILPFGRPGSEIRWVEIDPCYVFHEVNAFRRGDEVVIDVHRLAEVFNNTDLASGEDRLTRWIIDTSGEELSFREEIVGYESWDLAAHDRRFTGRKYQHSWHTEFRDHPVGVEIGGIGYLNYDTGEKKLWTPEPGRHVSEPFFVATGAGEGEGYIMCYTYDTATTSSTLAIFEAMDHTRGPIAEVELPQRVPYGFHGVWVPAES
ncbi:MAG: carotenoid oxygenase family protein, partial [Deltaproteobacteria bacterium]